MKKSALVIHFVLLSVSMTAQKKTNHITGIGAGFTELTWVDDKPAVAPGAYGGILINHSFFIGAYGSNILFSKVMSNHKSRFQFNHYGIYTAYRFSPARTLSLSTGVRAGMGWLENKQSQDNNSWRKNGNYTWVITPGLELNTRVTEFMQLQVYGAYRFTGNTNSILLYNSNFNGASAGIALVFGKF